MFFFRFPIQLTIAFRNFAPLLFSWEGPVISGLYLNKMNCGDTIN